LKISGISDLVSTCLSMQSAISAMRLGVVDKIFLEFDIDEEAAAAEAAAAAAEAFVPEPPPRASASGGATGELWNMGRRVDAEVVAAATAKATTAAMAVSSDADGPRPPRGARGNRRPRRQRKTIHTFAFMWPVPEPLSLGESGRAKAQALLPGGLTYNPRPGLPLSDLPSWLFGLHSIRFCPGPCWIEPSEKDVFHAREAGQRQETSTAVGAVLWITGRSAGGLGGGREGMSGCWSSGAYRLLASMDSNDEDTIHDL
jgi:hypothetical protein